MHNPKISIVTITYNSDKYLEDTIQSVISQDYNDLEYIIIDGGSTDKTMDIVNRYKEHISIVVSEKDKGISDAFNKGINRSSGEIVGIINSDDLLEPGALDAIAESYDKSVDVYSGNLLIWDDETNMTTLQKPEMSFDKLKLQYNVAHPSRFIRRDAYEKWGGYCIDLKYKMDIDLLVRFAKSGANFLYVDKSLARFRTGGTTSQSIWNKKKDYYLFVTRNGWSVFQFKCIWCIAVCKYMIKRLTTFLNKNINLKCK